MWTCHIHHIEHPEALSLFEYILRTELEFNRHTFSIVGFSVVKLNTYRSDQVPRAHNLSPVCENMHSADSTFGPTQMNLTCPIS